MSGENNPIRMYSSLYISEKFVALALCFLVITRCNHLLTFITWTFLNIESASDIAMSILMNERWFTFELNICVFCPCTTVVMKKDWSLFRIWDISAFACIFHFFMNMLTSLWNM